MVEIYLDYTCVLYQIIEFYSFVVIENSLGDDHNNVGGQIKDSTDVVLRLVNAQNLQLGTPEIIGRVYGMVLDHCIHL